MDRLQAESGLILTEFEVLTVVAFLYFAARRVDYLVLEVGLGGRLDATNVVVPKLAVITRIGIDHMAVLGNTLAAIAGEKAGIIKPKVPVVMGAQEAEAEAAIRAVADRNQAVLYATEDSVFVHPKEHNLSGQRFTLKVADRLYPDLWIKLLGPHQLENAATAACAWRVLAEHGAGISEAAFRQGLAAARWPARFEVVKTKPLTIIDGAHNLSGAEALARTVEQYLPAGRLLLVVGVLADKDVNGILRVFASFASKAVVTRPDSPRAAAPKDVAAQLRLLGVDTLVEPDIGRAVDKALTLAGPKDTVLVCGSLYLAGKARECLRRMK